MVNLGRRISSNTMRLNYIFSYLFFWQLKSELRIKLSICKKILLKTKINDFQDKFSYLRFYIPSKKTAKGIVLLDEFLVPQWVLVNSVVAQFVAQKNNSSIATFGFNPRSNFSEGLFRSFSANQHFTIVIKTRKLIRIVSDLIRILNLVRDKSELKSLEIRNVRVGIDIYESILRAGVPTVLIGSPRYFRAVVQGVVALNFYEWLIERKRVSTVLLSHDAYIGIGLLGKVAHKYDIPVYHANPYEIIRTKKSFEIYERFTSYPHYFNSVDIESREALTKIAQEDLARRLSGEIGVGLTHQTMSAFQQSGDYVFDSPESRKALIATHCFFDNPHGYAEMIFADFWEWLDFLGESTRGSNLEWYLKPHRDYLPGTLENLQQFASRFPHLRILPADTSFHYLKHNNFEVALTCYGSIGHELPLLGIAVVNCAYNPHIAYNFNVHCGSKEEIIHTLELLESSRPEINIDGLEEFYVVHNFLMRQDNFFFPSMTSYLEYVGDPLDFERCNKFVCESWEVIAARFKLILEEYLSQEQPNSTVYFLSKEKILHVD